ncbi:MAG: hypothetical protein ACLPN5_02250 [Roseiarcus sp.]
MSLPKPEPGLVIRYSYLWLAEHLRGQEEGVKDRPCAIVLASALVEDDTQVVVLPVTHSPPDRDVVALEIPSAIKRPLGLDSERSWIVLSESNRFLWPGPDLRRAGDRDDSSVAYGFLPPRFFAELQRRFIALEDATRSGRVTRTE